MSKRSVIVDTQALIYLVAIHDEYPIWDILRNLFNHLLVPEEVVIEFNKGLINAPERATVVAMLDESDFLIKCSAYDLFDVMAYKTFEGIDDGEAEVLAQQKKIGVDLIWSDDKKFKSEAQKLHQELIVFNTLHITALLHLHDYIEEYDRFKNILHKVRKVGKNFRSCYQEAATYLGVNLSNEEITERTRLS